MPIKENCQHTEEVIRLPDVNAIGLSGSYSNLVQSNTAQTKKICLRHVRVFVFDRPGDILVLKLAW
jgi:hypothetical protein